MIKLLTGLCAVALALLAAPAPAATLSFAAPPAAVRPGDSFTLDVRVAEVVDLYAFQFDIAFDPAMSCRCCGVAENYCSPDACTPANQSRERTITSQRAQKRGPTSDLSEVRRLYVANAPSSTRSDAAAIPKRLRAL